MQQVILQHDARNDEPLSEPVFLILLSLSPQPRHGYALIQDVAALTEGRVRLSTGTLYGALKRLLENGWIERFAQDDTSRDKQAYQLTPFGRQRLAADIERIQSLARIATTRLGEA
ncbi:MAG: helix-turn-helix transcriptional regulator [Bryobacteraceae bacterium]|nr:helix-turn-helix transcriptional regulator [Bryobacteraceae bacterium]